MTINGMILQFCQYLIGLVFFIPSHIIAAIGSVAPSCDSLGVVAFPADVINQAVQITRWTIPLSVFIPIGGLWTWINAVFVVFLFLWFWRHLPWLMSLSARIWVVIIILYLIFGAVDWFTGDAWSNDPVFNEAFGGSPTSTWSGGGFGGGGGGSW